MMIKKKINWAEALKPLIERYRGKKHPLNHHNNYELVVMVILSSQATDERVNQLSGPLFAAYPTLTEMAEANSLDLLKYVSAVRGSIKKSHWILDFARKLGRDDKIPKTMKELTAHKGIGRKSANVIIRESGGTAEGIIVDIHVLRVAPRIGVVKGDDAVKIEKQLMDAIPKNYWNDIGMAFSFLGREMCRPTDPNCPECPVNEVCSFYEREKKRRRG
jgi:endonuclease-3